MKIQEAMVLDADATDAKPLKRNDSNMCMIAPQDCRLTPCPGRLCQTPFMENEEPMADTVTNKDEQDKELCSHEERNVDVNSFPKENESTNKSQEVVEEIKKIPSIETDIRVKNYVQSLVPIQVIRKRFRAERKEEDDEDFLNYV